MKGITTVAMLISDGERTMVLVASKREDGRTDVRAQWTGSAKPGPGAGLKRDRTTKRTLIVVTRRDGTRATRSVH